MKFTSDNLYLLLKTIPKGKVTTYGNLAKAFGVPNKSRYIGKLLGKNKKPNKYPCFKVVKSDGSIGGFAFGIKDKIIPELYVDAVGWADSLSEG